MEIAILLSMSVIEMGKSLGLGKTESYWLVHKEQFETRFVAGKMRVMVESFERWYANQLHYKKISGELPGKELLKRTIQSEKSTNYFAAPLIRR